MADQFVQVPADSTGKKIDTSELTVGANTVERQRVVVGDPTSATALAAVKAASTAAAATDPALVVAVSPNNTIPVSAASLPLPTGAALDATLTGGTQKAIARGGAKGATAAADLTSNPIDANTQALHVDGSKVTQPISAASLPLPTGAALDATLTGKAAQFRVTDGTNTAAVKAASTVAAATDAAVVVTLSPNVPLHGTPLFVQSTDGTNNTPAADAAARARFVQVTDGTNILKTLDALARAGFMIVSDGTTAGVVDPTAKALRSSLRPWEVAGAYAMSLSSGAMTTVAAGGPVWSMRYTGAGLCVPIRVTAIWVVTTAFTAAQLLSHSLFVARSFSASDTGGTAATLTGNNAKYRTSHATTGVGDMRIGSTGAITAGTRTLDTQSIGTAFQGAAGIWGNSGDANGPAGSNELYHYNGNGYPIVLANNEGLVIANDILMGAAGVIKLVVNVEWVELASGAL